MTTVELMDKIVTDLFTKLNRTYHIEYTKLYKISRKYKNPNTKLKELLGKSQVFTDAKDLFLTSVNRETIRIMESSLAGISKKMGVSVGRVVYIADFKTINDIFIDGIDQQAIDAINQNMGINLYEDSKTAYANIAKALNKSLSQASFLMRETLNTTTRHITKLTYTKIEKDLSKYVIKYKYVGPQDGKTSACCAAKVGKVHTMAEWEAILPGIFTNGCHKGCRHSCDILPVKKGDLK